MTVLAKILEHELIERIGWVLVHSVRQRSPMMKRTTTVRRSISRLR